MKTKNKKIVCILISILFISSCKDNSTGSINDNEFIISGHIIDLPGDARIIKAIVPEYDTVSMQQTGSDNQLNLLLNPPSREVLQRINLKFSAYGDTGIISDTNARVGFVYLLVYNTATGNAQGRLDKNNSQIIHFPDSGYIFTRYLYSDRNTNIIGSLAYNNIDTLKYNYSLNLTKGYNTITYRLRESRNFLYFEYDVINGEQEGSNWIYYF